MAAVTLEDIRDRAISLQERAEKEAARLEMTRDPYTETWTLNAGMLACIAVMAGKLIELRKPIQETDCKAIVKALKGMVYSVVVKMTVTTWFGIGLSLVIAACAGGAVGFQTGHYVGYDHATAAVAGLTILDKKAMGEILASNAGSLAQSWEECVAAARDIPNAGQGCLASLWIKRAAPPTRR